MSKPSYLIDRRLVLKGAGSAIAAAATTATLPQLGLAQPRPDAVLLTISDLHAPYSRLPNLLATIRRLRNQTKVPTALLINGDIFERGNVVCLRSGGEADWTLLELLAKEMPVVVNLGNHETAIVDDMTTFLQRAGQAGVQVISNLMDRRTGLFFAPVSTRLKLGQINIGLLGLATTNPFVYRTEVRDTLTFSDTTQFVDNVFKDAMADSDLNFIMSHAGLKADKSFLNSLPKGTVVQGGHDHLDLDLLHNDVRYFHGSSWGTKIGVVSLNKAQDGIETSYRTERVEVGLAQEESVLAEIIDAQKSRHLTVEDRQIITSVPNSLDLHHSILLATEAMRRATDADLAMIGHTSFGAPLSMGPLTRYDFNAFVRFGGGLKVASVPGQTLMKILNRANQFAATSLENRSGDYVHVADVDLDAGKTYRLAVNAWTGINQQAYLGTTDLKFDDVQGLELKAVIADYLQTAF
ncbi:MAG: metallophosphoesterase [Rhizobiaceae bacterium]